MTERLVTLGGETPVALAPSVRVAVADDALAARLEEAIVSGLAAARLVVPVRRDWFRLDPGARIPEDAAGRLAVVPLATLAPSKVERTLRELEAKGVAGIQIVWDGVRPSRDAAEPALFAALERRRGRKGAPVVLAPVDEPCEALRRLAR